jgi:hypothetical protein
MLGAAQSKDLASVAEAIADTAPEQEAAAP